MTILKAFLDIMKTHVCNVPLLKDITDFKFPFWEDQLRRTVVEEGEVLSYLNPSALIKMHLAHLTLSKKFDSCFRKELDLQGMICNS